MKVPKDGLQVYLVAGYSIAVYLHFEHRDSITGIYSPPIEKVYVYSLNETRDAIVEPPWEYYFTSLMRMYGFNEIPEHWNWRWDGTPEGIIKIGKRASDLTRLGILGNVHTSPTQDGYWPLDDPDPGDTKAKLDAIFSPYPDDESENQ